jgi:hypothetical protein
MCHVEPIRIPKSVERIGEHCFGKCSSLCEITFEAGSNLKEIANCAFMRCSIKSAAIPKSVERIGKYCFGGCRLLHEVAFESDSKQELV